MHTAPDSEGWLQFVTLSPCGVTYRLNKYRKQLQVKMSLRKLSFFIELFPQLQTKYEAAHMTQNLFRSFMLASWQFNEHC